METLNFILRSAHSYSCRARAKRAEIFRQNFNLDANTRILDLGSENGQYIAEVLAGTAVDPQNVYIADIDPDAVALGAVRFGFNPVVLNESGHLPFPNGSFDIVHCSSVIEHVTVPKTEVWEIRSGKKFKALSLASQREFAAEIIRVGRQYWVQTPNKWFLIESHSWLPFIGWLPRRIQVPILRVTNSFWVKKTSPDWYLLDAASLSHLFEDSPINREKSLGTTKSLTVCKRL